MRIGLVITELDPGGAELCLTELALYLNGRGHDVTVWALGPAPRSQQTVLLDRLTQAGIDVQFGNARGTRDAWRITGWLRRRLDQFRPDIVQSMLWHANITTAWALWNRKVPWVAGMRVSEPRSGRWWLERLVSRRMQHMVCVSRDTMRHALEKERIAPELLSVIPNGVRLCETSVDTVTGLLPAAKVTGGAPCLLFVGRLEAQKGIHALSEQLPELLERLPGWHCVFVGQGSLQTWLGEKNKQQKLDERVHLVGWQANVSQWIQSSEILMLPAVYEGMPNVVLEAMAHAKPFVAFAVDGVQQIVDPGDGYPSQYAAAQTAAPGNWSEFIERVAKLASDAHLRQACGQANYEHIRQRFRLEDQLRKYELLYEKLVGI